MSILSPFATKCMKLLSVTQLDAEDDREIVAESNVDTEP